MGRYHLVFRPFCRLADIQEELERRQAHEARFAGGRSDEPHRLWQQRLRALRDDPVLRNTATIESGEVRGQIATKERMARLGADPASRPPPMPAPPRLPSPDHARLVRDFRRLARGGLGRLARQRGWLGLPESVARSDLPCRLFDELQREPDPWGAFARGLGLLARGIGWDDLEDGLVLLFPDASRDPRYLRVDPLPGTDLEIAPRDGYLTDPDQTLLCRRAPPRPRPRPRSPPAGHRWGSGNIVVRPPKSDDLVWEEYFR